MASYGADPVQVNTTQVLSLSKPVNLKWAHFLNNLSNEYQLFVHDPVKMRNLYIIGGISLVGLLYFINKK